MIGLQKNPEALFPQGCRKIIGVFRNTKNRKKLSVVQPFTGKGKFDDQNPETTTDDFADPSGGSNAPVHGGYRVYLREKYPPR
jgi:hypothetical protein